MKVGFSIGAGLGVAALAGLGIWFFFFRKTGGGLAVGRTTPLDPSEPDDGTLSGKITDATHHAFGGYTFSATIRNATRQDVSPLVTLKLVPGSGAQFGVDPYEQSERVTVPARSNLDVTFEDPDHAFAPFGTVGTITLSLDGTVVDEMH